MDFTHGNAIEFDVAALEILRSPGVYIYVKDDRAIYIGASRSMIGRALARNHHRRKDLLAGASLLLFPCKDLHEARRLEEQMIGELRPVCNERGGWKHAADLLGVTYHTVCNTYKQ
jgi:hypothetical protein